MKILGYMKVALLPLMILGTTMGSSIASQIPPTASPTLEESTWCRRESQREEREESPQSQTGRDITEVLTNLNKTLEPKYNRFVFFDGYRFSHGMNICTDRYFGAEYRKNQVFFFDDPEFLKDYPDLV